MKSSLLFIPQTFVLAILLPGCADSNTPDIPPVLTAIDEMEHVEFEQQMKNAQREMAARQKELPAAASPDSGDAPTSGTYVVEFETTAGPFTVTVNREWAPLGAQRFYELVKDKYYDDCGFFRVVPGFVVQWGLAADPAKTAAWDRPIPDEPVVQSNKPGYITFAKGGPNSRTAQVFISYDDNSRLDAMGFPAFGKVTKGMDAVKKISAVHAEEPDQGAITSQGNQYLKSNFPKLDYIKTARITVDDLAPEPAFDSEPAPEK
jgi:peptidyl-prolyl cis-trans isomerase A (cyclophilin A)